MASSNTNEVNNGELERGAPNDQSDDEADPRGPRYRKLKRDERSYRSMATFIDSDWNFMIYRRFGYLHARSLLRLQDKLRELEDTLEEYDKEDAGGGESRKLLLMSRRADEVDCEKSLKINDKTTTRTHLLDEIEHVLTRYDDLLLKAKQMVSLNAPAERDYKSVEEYFFNKKPVLDEEWEFIYKQEDLITLRDGREAILDSMTDSFLLRSSLLQSLFSTKRDRKKTDDPDVFYYNKSRKNVLNTTLLCVALLVLLVLPIYILYKLLKTNPDDTAYTISIGVIIVFMLFFSGVLLLFTRAKRHEIFTAAAGYCAVLMVFFGNIS